MNLAHVERYFADFLSGLESRKPLLPDLLREENLGEWQLRSTTTILQPLPRNLFVAGTVNVDETTYMFSPKVLDRASTFELASPQISLILISAAPRAPLQRQMHCNVDSVTSRKTMSGTDRMLTPTSHSSPTPCATFTGSSRKQA